MPNERYFKNLSILFSSDQYLTRENFPLIPWVLQAVILFSTAIKDGSTPAPE
jgi:hypothetical protein